MSKINNSLWLKIFIRIFLIFTVSSFLLMGILSFILRERVVFVEEDKTGEAVEKFFAELGDPTSDDARLRAEIFANRYNAYVEFTFEDGYSNTKFGTPPESYTGLAFYQTDTSVYQTRGRKQIIINAHINVFITKDSSVDTVYGMIFPMAVVFILLNSAISSFFLSRFIVRPIKEISKVSWKMAHMDMTSRITPRSNDEIGRLAQSLNTMQDKLSLTLSELESANEKLRKDIELSSRLEKERREFFAAASHELKTPITVIKGQIESMMLGIGRYKNTKEILPETMQEIEHMEYLVKEILDISGMEIDGLGQTFDKFNLSEVVNEILDEISFLSEEKGILLESTIDPDISIVGNRNMISKAVHNIIGNAVRHSPSGEKCNVTLTPSALTVVNTGITIPEDKLQDIFTPFYRVEGSHNKETGGSGLGLSIVKTILDCHKLDYRLSNGDNSVIFNINLPKRRNEKCHSSTQDLPKASAPTRKNP